MKKFVCAALAICFSSACFGAAVLTIQGQAQVGSNYIDFGNLAGTTFTPAPGYGAFTVTSVTTGGPFATAGVTLNEQGSVQSLDEGPGAVTLPGPFITFSAGGSAYQLFATQIPAPFTLTNVSQGVLATLEVDGYNTGASSSSITYMADFTIGLPGVTTSTVFNNLPIDGAFCATFVTAGQALVPCNPFPAAPSTPEPSYAMAVAAGLLGGLVVVKRRNARRA